MKRISTLVLGLCLVVWASGCCCGRFSRCIGWDSCCGMDPWGCGMMNCGGCDMGCGGGCSQGMGGGCQSGGCQNAGGGCQNAGGGCQSGNCGQTTSFDGNSMSFNGWTQTSNLSAPGEPFQAPPASPANNAVPMPTSAPTSIHPPK